jgi:hypothetical protein
MASQTSDRQRMSNDLRELAKLATKPQAARPAHHFEATTESSGFFDLSALLASEAARADRERALSPRGAPPPLPRLAARPFDIPAFEVPAHERMAPAAFEALGETEEMPTGRSSRGRKVVYALFSLASLGVVGYLALTLAQHPPPVSAPAPETTAAAVAPAPTTDPAPQSPTPAVAAAPTASAPAVADLDSTPAPSAGGAAVATSLSRSTKRAAPAAQPARVHVAAASPPPAAHAAAAHPAVIPASHPAPAGNDSLMDLIKKSVATGK